MIESMKTFFELYSEGSVSASAIDDFIDEWHTCDHSWGKLHEYLGLTEEQFAIWVEEEKLPEC
jgi:hypothetical protein